MGKTNRLFSIILILGFFFGCSTSKKTITEQPEGVRYSLVYVIHADANYTYHKNGKRRLADIDVLNRAIETGQNAKHGEVFIFHQKPERKLLFLIPQRDRVFYHYKNGELVDGNTYTPIEGGLQAEASLYNRKRSKTAGRNIFLYFGHEIPTEAPYLIYHQSQPGQRFNTEIFADNLSLFEDSFDLTILSTCNNGNPKMINALTGVTDYVVASPQNLHLSHLTDEPLKQLETNPHIPTEELAHSVAKQSFDRLSNFLQTMVTVAVYNVQEVENYVSSLSRMYQTHLNNIRQTSLFVNNIDCRDIPGFPNSLPDEGVTLYFKPADFGRNSSVNQHSGWGCKSGSFR